MKKKGFTLVELLAVIAILAILVVIALPNVLSMFNQAKSSTFKTEVQDIIGAAQNQWTLAQMESSSSITFVNKMETGGKLTLGTDDKENELDLDGNDKDYVVAFDQKGNVTTVFVRDGSFCYYKKADDGEAISKTDVVISDVKLVSDSDTASYTDGTLTATCAGSAAE